MKTIMKNFIFLMLAFVVLRAPAHAEQKSEVNMNLEEFQELFASARIAEAEQRFLTKQKGLEVEYQRKLSELEKEATSSKLREERENQEHKKRLFPENYQFLHQRAEGFYNQSSTLHSGVEGDVAIFEIELIFRILSPKWTLVPVINTSSIVGSDWEVAWNGESNVTDNNEIVATGEPRHVYSVLDHVENPNAVLLLRSEQQVLATNLAGLFRIRFSAHSRVRKTRNLNTVSLTSLLYPLSKASFRLCGHSGAPIAVKELSVQPAAAVLRVHPHDKGYTDIVATLPLSSEKIEIRWLDAAVANIITEEIDEEESRKTSSAPRPQRQQKPDTTPQVTVSHDALHSVDEGILQSTHILEFTSTSESSALNSVNFFVYGAGTRVTSVSGHSLSSWEAGVYNDTTSSTLVQAFFKSSHLDSTATLLVHTELDLDATAKTQDLELPRIECQKVLRQTGHIGIVKVANVEVHEHAIIGISRAEPSEFSSQLRLNTDRPIVLSYKYLSPHHSIILKVKEHSAVDTLEAVVDRVHYEALVTNSHTMHSLLVILQSSKLQYLALNGLPEDSSMFTLAVNGVQAKPVNTGSGNKNSILVPLLIGLDPDASNTDVSTKTSVELRYFSSHPSLGNEGKLTLPPPQLTIPVSVMTVELRLPKSYLYNFTGDFGSDPMDRLTYAVPAGFSYVKQKNVVKKGYKFSRLDDAITEDPNESRGAIKMTIPQTGRTFFFQRVLVVESALSLSAGYFLPEPPVPSFWESLMRAFDWVRTK